MRTALELAKSRIQRGCETNPGLPGSRTLDPRCDGRLGYVIRTQAVVQYSRHSLHRSLTQRLILGGTPFGAPVITAIRRDGVAYALSDQHLNSVLVRKL